MKNILTIVFLFSGICCQAQQRLSSADREIVFEDVNVIPMTNNEVLKHQVVVTKNGRIVAMGPVEKVSYAADAVVIKATGKFLMPGIAEMHAHIPPIDDVEPMKEVLLLFALNGVTTIRGMLGHPKHLDIRERIRKAELLGPNFYTTGPSFNGTSVESPAGAAAMVRKQKEMGYDYLKLHPGLSLEEFNAIATTANEVDIPFAGHVSFDVGVWRAIDAGYSSIDHLDGFIEGLVPGIEQTTEQQAGLFGMFIAEKANTSRVPKLMKELRDNKVWVVPTQSLAERWFHPDFQPEDFRNDPHSVYINPEVVDRWSSTKKNLISHPEYDEEQIRDFIELRRNLILECQKNGVGLLLGCDAPQVFNVPGFSTHHELEYLVLAGLSPYEALVTGTVNVAKYLGKKDSGVVRKGAVSDLILLHANPLEDITNTTGIAGVMLGNQWMDRRYIDTELEKLKKS